MHSESSKKPENLNMKCLNNCTIDGHEEVSVAHENNNRKNTDSHILRDSGLSMKTLSFGRLLMTGRNKLIKMANGKIKDRTYKRLGQQETGTFCMRSLQFFCAMNFFLTPGDKDLVRDCCVNH